MVTPNNRPQVPPSILQDYCNQLYASLIARFGEISIQQDKLALEKAKIEAQIALLNALSPELQAKELEIVEKSTRFHNDASVGC